MKALFSLLPILLFFCGCNSNPADTETDNTFAIYLTKDIDNNSPVNVSLDKLVLEDEPILSEQSIESYVWENHKITFGDETKELIKLKEPLFGKHFIVTAQKQRIYWGMFTDNASSASCNNPVIIVWSREVYQDTNFITNEFVIDRDYMGHPDSKNNKDLRVDSRIYNALLRNGKLK